VREPARSTLAPSSCAGVSIFPGDDLQAKILARAGGTTFCVKKGVHSLTTGVLVKSHDRIVGERGAVLDGQNVATTGLYGHGGRTGQRDVTVVGLGFRNFTGAAISPGWGWLVKRNNVQQNDVGIVVNNGSILRNNRVHHNGRIGISGGPVTTVLIEGNQIAFNNTRSHNIGVHAGGLKIIGGSVGSSGIRIRSNWVHDNTGAGVWLDTNVRGVTIAGNVIEGNTSHGIFYETSWNAAIRGNRVLNNASQFAGKSCFWGSQIHVNDSQGVEIARNVVRSSDGSNGICAVDIDRTSISSKRVAGLSVHDNVIRMTKPGMTGLVGRPAAYRASARNRFTGNIYYVTDPRARWWAWSRYPIGWRAWRSYGNDVGGSLRRW
jgi:parallel beta-helix repeat protein